jgi:hypothetical protein
VNNRVIGITTPSERRGKQHRYGCIAGRSCRLVITA